MAYNKESMNAEFQFGLYQGPTHHFYQKINSTEDFRAKIKSTINDAVNHIYHGSITLVIHASVFDFLGWIEDEN
jgi:hypothetical protein